MIYDPAVEERKTHNKDIYNPLIHQVNLSLWGRWNVKAVMVFEEDSLWEKDPERMRGKKRRKEEKQDHMVNV